MTTAFFLRHGLTQENHDNRIQGQLHGTLRIMDTERYIAAVVPLLRQKSPNVILSSDLDRAIHTRRILKTFLQIADANERKLPLLRERAMGYYEGMLWEDVPAAYREEMQKHEYDFRPFGGESNDDVRARVQATLKLLGKEYGGKKVVCVTHAGWLHELVAVAGKSESIEDGWTHRQCIYEVTIYPDGAIDSILPIQLVASVPEVQTVV